MATYVRRRPSRQSEKANPPMSKPDMIEKDDGREQNRTTTARDVTPSSKTGRTITDPRYQALLEAAKQEASSTAPLADRKRRQHLMERSFEDAANCHGFKRAHGRRTVRR